MTLVCYLPQNQRTRLGNGGNRSVIVVLSNRAVEGIGATAAPLMIAARSD